MRPRYCRPTSALAVFERALDEWAAAVGRYVEAAREGDREAAEAEHRAMLAADRAIDAATSPARGELYRQLRIARREGGRYLECADWLVERIELFNGTVAARRAAKRAARANAGAGAHAKAAAISSAVESALAL